MPLSKLLCAAAAAAAALGGAAAAPEEAKPAPAGAAGALLADDECGAEGVGCALSAVQLRRSMDLGNASLGEDHPFISGCKAGVAGKECPSPLSCVTKPDGTWSQCVDCTSVMGFQKDCIEMNAEMRQAAVAECGRTCPFTTPRPLHSGCNDSEVGSECPKPLKCVTTADGTWSQCVDCSSRFYQECQKLKDPVRLAAVNTCRRTCVGSKCDSQEWCRKPYHCVGSHTWAQCIRCDTKTFKYACHHWKPDFRSIAEEKCHRHCRR